MLYDILEDMEAKIACELSYEYNLFFVCYLLKIACVA